MAMLHIVNHEEALAACLEVAAKTDVILLIEDGVQVDPATIARELVVLPEDSDPQYRKHPPDNVRITDYAGFVELVANHQPIVSWGRSSAD